MICIPTLLGLESIVKDEIKNLSYPEDAITAQDGQVLLDETKTGDSLSQCIARLNINIRCGERILIQVKKGDAQDFDALFDCVNQIKWSEYIKKGSAFIIDKGYSRKSKLTSIPTCQSIIKKAVVQRLKKDWSLSANAFIEEDIKKGQTKIQFSIMADQVTIFIDTTGVSLHKRGYRPQGSIAPIRETLAAAMVYLSRTRFDGSEAVVDPFCGSGTIPIEAAMIGYNIAPGLNRSFLGEEMHFLSSQDFEDERDRARSLQKEIKPGEWFIYGTDIDQSTIRTCKNNARRAGVFDAIYFQSKDVLDYTRESLQLFTKKERVSFICNPPYGERLADPEEAQVLMEKFAKLLFDPKSIYPNYRAMIIFSDLDLESVFGFYADKRRKLYNGMIPCMTYQYFKKQSKPYKK